MKLVRIDHFRCDQPAGKWGLSTYVWVADDMTQEEFSARCDAARDRLLAYEHGAKERAPISPPGYGATIQPNTPDTLTVGELKKQYEEAARLYKEYQDTVQRGRQSFSQILVNESNGRIQYLWKPEPALKHDVDWGHNHGTQIDYSETVNGDYPPDEDDETYL